MLGVFVIYMCIGCCFDWLFVLENFDMSSFYFGFDMVEVVVYFLLFCNEVNIVGMVWFGIVIDMVFGIIMDDMCKIVCVIKKDYVCVFVLW